MRILLIVWWVGALFFQSCATKPVDTAKIKGVKAKATVNVKDLKKNDSHDIDMNIYASFDKMRIEGKATMLGIPVALLIASQDKVEALLLREKKYISGSSDKIFQRLVEAPIKIGLLFKIVYYPRDPYLINKCTRVNPQGRCAAKIGTATLEWPSKVTDPKVFIIKSAGYEITWEFSSTDYDWEPDPRIFEMKIPQDYNRDVLN